MGKVCRDPSSRRNYPRWGKEREALSLSLFLSLWRANTGGLGISKWKSWRGGGKDCTISFQRLHLKQIHGKKNGWSVSVEKFFRDRKFIRPAGFTIVVKVWGEIGGLWISKFAVIYRLIAVGWSNTFRVGQGWIVLNCLAINFLNRLKLS